MGIETVQRRVSRSELYVADEAFFSGTAAEITPILSIDKKKVGDGQMGPVTARIKAALTKVTKGEDPKYSAWLTPVY
jgi:branched-chain amino acid aminotransferase